MPPAKLASPRTPAATDCRIREGATPCDCQKDHANRRSSVPMERPPSDIQATADSLPARGGDAAWTVTASCRQPGGFAAGASYFGRGAAEGSLEGPAERALAFETECLGDLADRGPGVAHQGPGLLQPQPRCVLGRGLAEHVAMDADQVPGGIACAACKPREVGPFAFAVLDQVADAEQAQHGLLAPLPGPAAAACDQRGKIALLFDDGSADRLDHPGRVI